MTATIDTGRTAETTPARVQRAAALAPKAYPGPVGELLRRELEAWDDFGHELGGHVLIGKVIGDIFKRTGEP